MLKQITIEIGLSSDKILLGLAQRGHYIVICDRVQIKKNAPSSCPVIFAPTQIFYCLIVRTCFLIINIDFIL